MCVTIHFDMHVSLFVLKSAFSGEVTLIRLSGLFLRNTVGPLVIYLLQSEDLPVDGTICISNSRRCRDRGVAENAQTCYTCVVWCIGVETLIATDDFLMRISFHNVLVLINCSAPTVKIVWLNLIFHFLILLPLRSTKASNLISNIVFNMVWAF